MNYEEFLTEAKETLTMLLSEDYPGISVETVNVDKLQNSSYRGLSIKEAGTDVAMTMDMMPVFEEIQEGRSKELVLGSFAREVRKRMEEMPNFDVGVIRNYDVMKENLSIQMVSIQGNEKMLSDVPHKVMADLAAVYRIQVGRDTSFLVTNDMIRSYGITEARLMVDAEKYAPQHAPLSIRSMAEVMAEMMPPGMELPDQEPKMFVATVQEQAYGSGVLVYPQFMEMAEDRLEGDFFVLPSSVHELLLVPDNGEMKWRELEEMVKTVNATTVDPKEQLSDHVYHYDCQDKVFELASSHELRMTEKSLEQSLGKNKETEAKAVEQKSGKKSVLEELRNSKAECEIINSEHTPAKNHLRQEER